MNHIVSIEKLVFEGVGLARLEDGKAVFVWNALPGEKVEIKLLKNKKDFAQAVAITVLEASPERIEPKEDMFLSTSPWQIMSPEAEEKHKLDIAIETFGRNGGLILQTNPPKLYTPEKHFGYRNKLEFSFCELEDETKSLAFFDRGTKNRKPVSGSMLAEPIINKTAQHILKWVNTHNIPMRSLKSIIVRSNGKGQSIAALFIKDELEFSDFPELMEHQLGFQLYYSTHKSPASVPTKLMYSTGQDYLIAEILGTQLKFGLLSFFQVNIPVFEKTLQDIAAFVGPHEPLLDFYSGVGAIGLPLAKNREHTVCVDSNSEAIEYATENISLNSLPYAEAHCAPAEKMLDAITKDKIIIVDPPRAGLHKDVVHKLATTRPKRIIYLSCNIATQARDIQMLSELYKPTFIKLYNFFPRTPHIESLVVLDLL